METKYEYKTKPFKHQLEALLQSARKKNFAYFMEMGCVDGDTEFLTQRGWVKFSDFNLDEWKRPLLVAQAIPVKDDITRWGFEFTEPIAYIKKPAYDWVRLHGRRYTQNKPDCTFVVTADHTLPVTYEYKVGARQKVVTKSLSFPDCTARFIDQIYNKKPDRDLDISIAGARIGYIPYTTEGLKGFDSEYFVPDPEVNALNEWELRFMVAAIADGTFPNKTNNKCDFYFIKERKCERLRMLAARAGVPMAEELYKGRKKDITIFHAIAPMRCKIFDERWYSLPQRALEIIASEVFYWDGWSGEKKAEFYTIHEESASFIQYALMASGWNASIIYNGCKKIYAVAAPYPRCRNNRVFQPHVTYDTLFSVKDTPLGVAEAFTEEQMSYCFRVPSGYLVLRRGNKIFISGNSGKTKVMIDNMGMLHKAGHISGALVLAPKGVYRNWSEKEIPTHLPDDIKRELIVWDAGASASKKDALSKQIKNWDGKTFQIMVFNIESLISEKGRKLIVDFINRHDGNIFALVDESTCIKNHKAKRTKAAIDIGQKCKVRRIATGSPITNSPLDLFSQCAFLDKRLLGYGSYYAFKNTYAEIERIQNRQGQHYEKILSYRNLDDLSNKLDTFSYRVTKRECLDLPDKIYTTRDVELTPEQQKIYTEMSNHQFALLQKNENEFHEMSAQVILTKMLRLHQVLCGTFVNDEGELIPIPNNRINALKEVLDETSGKAIIWATYIADIEAIQKMIAETYGEDSYVMYYGKTSADDRVKAIEQFQDPSSPVRFFIGNVQTAGRGITLTAASTVIYYSNNFSLELRQQSEDRAHRLGQNNKVTYIDLVVRGSLDEKIIKSLIEKRNIANEILKDNLEEWISLKVG